MPHDGGVVQASAATDRGSMYIGKHDDERGLAIWRFVGSVTPQEWKQHIADIDRVARWQLPDRPSVILEIIGFTPNAGQRAELAEHSATPTYRPYLAFVSTNALLRGTLQAIAWKQAKKHYEEAFFSNTDAAIRWLEEQRGSRLEALLTLRSAVDRAARSASL
jgi:hypothetical protein